jgi:4-amino-4-deoxy-L-arabinose transferase
MTRRPALALMLLAFVLFYLVPLPFHGLWIPDETRYAQISQEMLLSGRWATPHFMGLRYFEKPAGGYWMIAAGQALFGQNLFGVRIASALSLGLSVVLAWVVSGALWRDRHTQWVCAVVYMSLSVIVAGAGYANLDPLFTLWVNASFVALWYAISATRSRPRRVAWVLLGVACALGFLTKGFLALLLPMLVAVPVMLRQRRALELMRLGLLAVVAALVVALPWALVVHSQEADYWNYFFWDEHIRRFAGDDAQHAEPWYFYLPIMVLASLPWLLLLPHGLFQAWRARQQPAMAFVGLWLLLPLALFSVARGKLPAYILPCLLPMALLIGHGLRHCLDLRRTGMLRSNAGLNALMGVLGLIALAYLQARRPLYQDEPQNLGLLVLALGGWTLANGLAVWRPLRLWLSPAIGMGLAMALIPAALPERVVNNKTPDVFIAEHAEELAQSHSLLSNELGTASALAWHTRRPQVTLYNTSGETRYGLKYPDAQGRWVRPQEVVAWMQQARLAGSVAVVMRVKGEDEREELALLPPDARRYEAGNIVILLYDAVVP